MFKNNKKCIECGAPVRNKDHDLCYDCWTEREEDEEELSKEDHFDFSLLDNKIYTVLHNALRR